ncbi:MAG TPA: ADP-dependent glucokinase/phosphofructokinase [Limnochordia bacterium]|nr:ADP-dependent glucokinase/phosphofructokinase [Limnochordia bacterium]
MIQDPERTFSGLLAKVVTEPLAARTFACFNSNIDVVAHVTSADLARIIAAHPGLPDQARALPDLRGAVESPAEWLAVMRECFLHGKSVHTVTKSAALLAWLAEQFPVAKRSMGGQAGIIANQMASLGARSICYTTMLSPEQAELFVQGVECPTPRAGRCELLPPRAAADPGDQVKINWIFEYGKDERFDFAGEIVRTPRANRMIMATHPPKVMGFATELRPHLRELGSQVDIGFVAGYHYAMDPMPDGRSYETYMADSLGHLASLRSANPKLRLHYEYVPLKERALEGDVLTRIARVVDSFGINEVEIKRALDNLGLHEELRQIEAEECARTLYLGVRALKRRLGFARIHLHNLGYYVILLDQGYAVSPERAQQAALYASAVNAMKAKYGGYPTAKQVAEAAALPLSEIGLAQLARFGADAAELGLEPVGPGIWADGPDRVLLVPAHVWPNPVSTVGMGDTISSSSFAMEFAAAGD